MDKTNSKLPRGWALSRLEEIAMFNPRHPSELDPSIEVSFVPMPALDANGWKLKPSQKRALGEVRKGYTHFATGDVLFAKITPCMENGKAAVAEDLANGLGCGTTELHVIRPVQDFQSKFLYYFVHREDFRKAARQNMTGTAGQLRVPLSFLKESEIPVPPTAEQIRIIAKLEKLLAKIDACKERLEKIPAILKRFRQSVLAAAFGGTLTSDWRFSNPDIAPAADLLKEIGVVRLSLATTTKERNRLQERHHSQEEKLENTLSELLPNTWTECTIGSIGDVQNGSTPSRKNPGYWNGKIPWVSSGEVRNNEISTTREQISEEGFRNSSVRWLPPGTVLLAMIGEGKTRGQSAILRIKATINQNIAAVVIDHGLILPKYTLVLVSVSVFPHQVNRKRTPARKL